VKRLYAIPLVVIFSILQYAAYLQLECLQTEMIFIAIGIAGRCIIAIRMQTLQLAALTTWVYTELSFFGWIIAGGINLENHALLQTDGLIFSCRFGAVALLVQGLGYHLLDRIVPAWRSCQERDPKNNLRAKTYMMFILFALFSIFLSLFSNWLGISGMSMETNVLPYKLGGLINISRQWLIPCGFICFIDYMRCAHKRTQWLLMVVFLLWALVDSYVRTSKGFVFSIALLWLFYKASRGKITVGVAAAFGLMAVIAMVLFPFFGALRNVAAHGQRVNLVDLQAALVENQQSKDDYGFALMFTRQFSSGLYLTKYADYLGIDTSGVLDEVNEVGGPAAFHTGIIDGIPVSAMTSSGSSTFASSFLIAGKWGALAGMVFVTTLAFLIDRKRLGLFTATPVAVGTTLWLNFMYLNEDHLCIIYQFTMHGGAIILCGLLLSIYHRKFTAKISNVASKIV